MPILDCTFPILALLGSSEQWCREASPPVICKIKRKYYAQYQFVVRSVNSLNVVIDFESNSLNTHHCSCYVRCVANLIFTLIWKFVIAIIVTIVMISRKCSQAGMLDPILYDLEKEYIFGPSLEVFSKYKDKSLILRRIYWKGGNHLWQNRNKIFLREGELTGFGGNIFGEPLQNSSVDFKTFCLFVTFSLTSAVYL